MLVAKVAFLAKALAKTLSQKKKNDQRGQAIHQKSAAQEMGLAQPNSSFVMYVHFVLSQNQAYTTAIPS
jgi:hypothetical protein